MSQKSKDSMKVLLITCAIVLAMCLIWMLLELLFYGAITARIIDDIIMVLVTPFIYWAVLHFQEKD